MAASMAADPDHSAPVAGGKPISEAVAEQAADWLTLLMSGKATDADRRRWQHWRDGHPDHQRAWQHIEAVTGRLKRMESHAAYTALSPYAGPEGLRRPGRRKALRLLLWGGIASTSGWLVSGVPIVQQMAADYRTLAGEQRTVTLADGTAVTLNTASAIDVRFDGRRRLLRLVAGEVLIVTGHALNNGAADPRSFVVETAEGHVRALGTCFTVRQRNDSTQVAVLESAVEITPHAAAGEPRLLRAGEQVTFTRASIDSSQPGDDQAAAWSRGQIVADEMRLGEFLDELGRYRTGIIHCAPAVADLRFSGVFPLHDTDRILATLPSVLPVQVTSRTRYWVAVEAAR